VKNKRPLHEWSAGDFRKFSKAFANDVVRVFDVTTALSKRKATGAPSPANVRARLQHWKKALSRD
jgi:argininosuccinate lyase